LNKRIYVPDIECDSCSKVISKRFSKKSGITNFAIKQDYIDVDFDENETTDKEIITTIKELGFRADTNPFERKTLKERVKHYKENKHKYKIEKKVIGYAIGIFFILSLLELLSYYLFLQNMPNFLATYGWWLFYLNISVATISLGMWHVEAYRAKVTCMVGMMIGMTIGMQTGMMIGVVFGATNGFFIGAMVGMILGTIVGIITGRCCGVMGVMEGMMAGLMGGTMGPMISVMMFSDHLLWFMPFYMIINIVILWGLSYMVYEEVVEGNINVIKKSKDFSTLTSIAVIVTFILLTIMIYGPKTSLLSLV